MHCFKPGCKGELSETSCPVCGSSWSLPEGIASQGQDTTCEQKKESFLPKISARLKALENTPEPAKDDLLSVSASLETLLPDKYETWRAQADLWLAALHQLEKRLLMADTSIMLMGVPLLEEPLRDAAEAALRHCAHFASTLEERITLIDEANSIRKITWF